MWSEKACLFFLRFFSHLFFPAAKLEKSAHYGIKFYCCSLGQSFQISASKNFIVPCITSYCLSGLFLFLFLVRISFPSRKHSFHGDQKKALPALMANGGPTVESFGKHDGRVEGKGGAHPKSKSVIVLSQAFHYNGSSGALKI